MKLTRIDLFSLAVFVVSIIVFVYFASTLPSDSFGPMTYTRVLLE